MKHLLDNPVYHALCSGDKHLGSGTDKVRFFDESVSPFAGFEEGYAAGFKDLYHLLPPGRTILYAVPYSIPTPEGWESRDVIEGLQFVYDTVSETRPPAIEPVPLDAQHVEQMVELAKLTRPGPFGTRTIDFGNYFGIFENKQLVAMTGQRLHLPPYSELSAVCTHPNHLGKGYAAALVQHGINRIVQQQQIPFLHVRADNLRAIELYHRLGFTLRGPMNFYVLKRRMD